MTYFFTQLDDSLRPRGSRDPLGAEMIWASVGRELVGNLTTVTAHLDNFVFVLLGFVLCSDAGKAPEWERFQRFEQVTSRARIRIGRPEGVLGRRRIEASLSLESIPIGPQRTAQILENQRQAGLWGLYSTALAATGLAASDRSLTGEGLKVIKGFLPAWQDLAWLGRTWKRQMTDELHDVDKWVGQILKNAKDRTRLAECLLSGGENGSEWQMELFEQAKRFMHAHPNTLVPRAFLAYLVKHSELLKEFAARLEQVDEALILADTLFSALLGCHGYDRAKIAKHLEVLRHWPKREDLMIPAFPEVEGKEWAVRANRLRHFLAAAATGDFLLATDRLLEHHAAVVTQRGGVPWCFWEGDKFKVVTSENAKPLPGQEDLEQKFSSWADWRTNGFFLGSFLAVLQQSGMVKRSAQKSLQEVPA